MKFGLKTETIKAIQEILAGYPEVDRAIIYGSRARGNYRTGSDIDLTLTGEKLTLTTLQKIENEIDDLLLPYKVDLSLLHHIQNVELLEHIERVGKVFYDRNNFTKAAHPVNAASDNEHKNTTMSDWKEYKLGELGAFFGGVTNIKREDYGHGYPFLQYMNVYKNWKVDIDNLELMNVKLQDLEKRSCIYGDIFFTASSETEEEVAMSSVLLNNVPNLTFNGFCKRFRLHNFKTLLPEFARYYFRGPQFRGEVYQRVTGDVRFNISHESLADIPILLPPLPEQRAIAEVLSSLDDKIDLLHRQNKTLEQLAETLFRQWFIEEAEESWEVGTVENVVSLKGGTTPSTSEQKFWDGNIHWTSPRDLANATSIFLFDTSRKITEEGLNQISSGLLPVGTLLLSSRAPIGYLALTEIPVAINQGYIAIICNKIVSNYYMFLWCKDNMETIKNAGNGSVFQEISKSAFRTLDFIIPPKEKLKNFDREIEPLFQKIKSNTQQIRTLTQLRDALLPKLMSGEIRLHH